MVSSERGHDVGGLQEFFAAGLYTVITCYVLLHSKTFRLTELIFFSPFSMDYQPMGVGTREDVLLVMVRPVDNRPDHDQQHCYHHAPTVKPEAATAVVELLMMGVRNLETC